MAYRADYEIRDEGTIVLIVPITEAATEWLDSNLPDDRLRWGRGSVVEPRYVAAIVSGMTEAGLLARSLRHRQAAA